MIRMPQVRRCLIAVCVLSTLLLVGSATPIGAQEVLCTDLIDRFRKALTACDVLNNNDICYGDALLEALPAIERFEQPRDRAPLAAVDEIVARNETGTVVMYLSVGEADPVKVITVGGVDLLPNDVSGATNSFTITTAQDSKACEQTDPGLLVYTESGEQGSITVNGMQIELESIAFIALSDLNNITVTNMDGTVRVTAGEGEEMPAVDEAVVVVDTDEGPEIVGAPSPSDVADSDLINWLAFDPEGMASIENLNETELGCNLDEVSIPFTGELEIHEPGHECQITFCTSGADVVSVELEALDPGLDPWLDLRRPDSRILTFSDDRGDNNQDSLICNQTLPVSGCYTVVARSYRNEAFGSFRLIIDGETDCEPPIAICEVVYHAGLNLRSAPDLTAPLIKSLPQGTRLRPIQSEVNWTKVIVARTGQTGWIWCNPVTVNCDCDLPSPPTVTPKNGPTERPPPTVTERPPPPPPPVPPEPGPPKDSPFGPP